MIETRLAAVPDLTNYIEEILRSEDHYLAVKLSKKRFADGKAVYKVTAAADNLVQRDAQNHFARTYSYYIEKPGQLSMFTTICWVGQCHSG